MSQRVYKPEPRYGNAMQNSIYNYTSPTQEAAVVLRLEYSKMRLIGYRPIS